MVLTTSTLMIAAQKKIAGNTENKKKSENNDHNRNIENGENDKYL